MKGVKIIVGMIMDVTKAIEEEVVSIHQKEKKNPNSYSSRDHGR